MRATQVKLKNKKTVSFDFDGVIHQSVKVDKIDANGNILSYGPFDYNLAIYKTNPLIIDKIYEEAKFNNLIIITARSPEYGGAVINYLRKMGLTKLFKGIYFCPNNNKVSKMKTLGVIRHYEDSPKYFAQIVNENIELVKVFPLSPKIFE